MKRNEKILAGGFALLIVGWFGVPMLDGLLFDAVREGEANVEKARKDVRDREVQSGAIRAAAKRMGDASRQSLPGDALDAQRLYQQWLTDLAAASGLDRVDVRPGSRTPNGQNFVAVQVSLDGQAPYAAVTRFLTRFREADLLQRVSRLTLTPNGPSPDDPVQFSITAEGLSLADAAKRDSVLPQTQLAEPLTAKGTQLRPKSTLPKLAVGERLRIAREFLTVTAVADGTWTVERGAEGGTPQDHATGATVEWFRRDAGRSPVPAGGNPFAKPRVYAPRLDGLRDAALVRGKDLKLELKVADFDASGGFPVLKLTDAPAGATLDPATGVLTWTPGADTPAGPRKLTVKATVPRPAATLERSVTVTLTDPNTPPRFEPTGDLAVLVGESLVVPLLVSDAEDKGNLKFALENAPEGASVSNGVLYWDVPAAFTPGETALTVVATDSGTPPLSAKSTLKIAVREDLRPFVFLVGAIADGAERQGWLYDRAENRNTVLREGEEFAAAGLTGLVREIGRDFVRFERNGVLWRLVLGKSLVDAERLMTVAAERPPVEAPKPDGVQ